MIENIEIIVKSNAEKETNPLKDLRKEINGLKSDLLQLEAGTDEYNAKALELANATKTLKDINEEARFAAADLGDQLATTNRIATGLASGFSAVQGVMALFGAEGENLQKIMVKLQAGIALVQGLQGMEGLVRDLEIAKIQFRGGLTAVKGFIGGLSGIKKALLATGIGAFIVLIGTLIAYWDEIAEKLGFATKKQEEYNKQLEEQKQKEKERRDSVSSSVAGIISKYNLLQAKWRELKTQQEKTDWIRDNADAFSNLGLAITDVASAQDVLINKAEAVIRALTLQAEAAALQEIYQESYKEAYKRARELDAEMADIKANPIKAGYDTNDDFREKYNLGSNSFNKKTGYFQYTTRQEWSKLLGEYQTVYTYTDKLNASGADYVQQQREQAVQDQLDVVYAESNSILADVQAKEAEAAEAAAEVSKYVVGNKRTTTSSYSSNDIDDTISKIATIQERVRQSLIQGKEDELAELERIYLEEKALLEKNGADTALLTEEYELEKAKIEEKYRKQKEAEDKEAQEIVLEQLDKNLAEINDKVENSLTTVEIDYQMKALEIPENDAIGAISLEIEKEKELMAIRQQAFNEQMLQIQTAMNSEVLSAEQKNALLEEYKALEQEKVLSTAQSNAQIATLNNDLAKAEKAKVKETFNNVSQIASAALSGASQLISALQQNVDTTTKEGFEKNKQLQKANTWINVASGILSAVSSAMSIPPPVGPILAGINSAFVLATGIAQIAAINKQKFDGSGGSDGGGVSVPNVSATMMPNEVYANQLATQTEIDLQSEQTNTRVYVVESDITDTQNSAKTKVSESEF